jgi:hypothetical protein
VQVETSALPRPLAAALPETAWQQKQEEQAAAAAAAAAAAEEAARAAAEAQAAADKAAVAAAEAAERQAQLEKVGGLSTAHIGSMLTVEQRLQQLGYTPDLLQPCTLLTAVVLVLPQPCCWHTVYPLLALLWPVPCTSTPPCAVPCCLAHLSCDGRPTLGYAPLHYTHTTALPPCAPTGT